MSYEEIVSAWMYKSKEIQTEMRVRLSSIRESSLLALSALGSGGILNARLKTGNRRLIGV